MAGLCFPFIMCGYELFSPNKNKWNSIYYRKKTINNRRSNIRYQLMQSLVAATIFFFRFMFAACGKSTETGRFVGYNLHKSSVHLRWLDFKGRKQACANFVQQTNETERMVNQVFFTILYDSFQLLVCVFNLLITRSICELIERDAN